MAAGGLTVFSCRCCGKVRQQRPAAGAVDMAVKAKEGGTVWEGNSEIRKV